MDKITFWKAKNKGLDKKRNNVEIKLFSANKTNKNRTKKLENVQEKHFDDNITLSNSQIERQQKLTKYCIYLESVVKNAQNILDESYENTKNDKLSEHLKRDVNELVSLQKQMKSIVDTNEALKLQINAVRLNFREQKRKFKSLKNEENVAKFALISEKTNLNYKNSIKFRRDSILNIRAQSSSSTPICELSTEMKNVAKLSAPQSIATSTAPNVFKQHSRKNSAFKSNDRTLLVTNINKNSKLNQPPHNTNDERKPGVTIYLHPINETENFENEEDNLQLTQSHPVTPNTSIINFPWLSISTPSDTTTHPESLPSDAYSLSNED